MMDNKKTLRALTAGLAAYQQIVDKEIHYVFREKNAYSEIILKPHKKNFMHLSGVKCKDSKGNILSPKDFYRQLKNKKLYINGIIKNSFSDQKLHVLPLLSDLTKCNVRVINTTTTYANLTFDFGIRSRKRLFCVALEMISSHFFVPKSLINLTTDNKGKYLTSGHLVHCIYAIDQQRNVHYLCKSQEFVQYEQTNTYNYDI